MIIGVPAEETNKFQRGHDQNRVTAATKVVSSASTVAPK